MRRLRRLLLLLLVVHCLVVSLHALLQRVGDSVVPSRCRGRGAGEQRVQHGRRGRAAAVAVLPQPHHARGGGKGRLVRLGDHVLDGDAQQLDLAVHKQAAIRVQEGHDVLHDGVLAVPGVLLKIAAVARALVTNAEAVVHARLQRARLRVGRGLVRQVHAKRVGLADFLAMKEQLELHPPHAENARLDPRVRGAVFRDVCPPRDFQLLHVHQRLQVLAEVLDLTKMLLQVFPRKLLAAQLARLHL
mmetsp:Transcript_22948/g.57517  ORF Transcript_22948/g.57517 Transcript_22948/m.57517 type:complete len:245 (+) Transcript_22948:893-1627(+)